MDTSAATDAGKDDSAPGAASLRGLDLINLFAADVRDGLGPYLAEFLKGSQHWSPGPTGFAVGMSSLAAGLCQIPAGLLVDASRYKRVLVAGAGVIVACGSLLIAFAPKPVPVFMAQAGLGLGAAVIVPCIAALSLGIVHRQRLPARISRNEGFNHGGNFLFAGGAGLLGALLGYVWVFYLAALFALLSAVAALFIRPADVNDEIARGQDDQEDGDGGEPARLVDLFKRRDLCLFLVSVLLFHMANGGMLPLAGQALAAKSPGSAVSTLSGCIVAAQATMVLVAMAVGRAIRAGVGRKRIFLLAFAVLPVRGVLFSIFSSSAPAVIAIQALDGVAAGIFGVISVVMAADLMAGTGRSSLAQALTLLALGVGAGISNGVAGLVVEFAGFPAGFLTLAGVAIVALLFFLRFGPETAPAPSPDAKAA
jgi:MFS family permease